MFYESGFARRVSWLLLLLGLVALAVSIIAVSTVLAFIGLGLVFWGATLLYVSTEKYVKQRLLGSTITPSLTDLNQILTELKYQGKAIYLPPKYLQDIESTKLFITKNKNVNLPSPDELHQKQDKVFITNPEAIFLTPPGLHLSELFEKTLGTRFTQIDLEYLKKTLPKLFVEELEIAETFEVENDLNTIRVRITNSVFAETCRQVRNLSRISDGIGDPISSAIACALAKATGEPVTIENAQLSKNGEKMAVTFLLETLESEERRDVTAKLTELPVRPRAFFPNFGLLFITSGILLLGIVSWLTWYDLTIWGKDIFSIFFGSRIGEEISLGIGMKVIYYVPIGLALLFLGLHLLRRRRGAG